MMNSLLSRDDTQALKGVAILLMIMHHVLIADYYVSPPAVLSSTIAVRLMMLGKLCVGIYTFIIGYGYAFSSKHDWNYSFKHIMRLLAHFWPLFVVFMLLGLYNGFVPEPRKVGLGLFGLRADYNCASWFVYFYIFSMMALPGLARWIDRYHIKAVAAVMVFCAVAWLLLPLTGQGLVVDALKQCLLYCPVLASGYFVAKYDWSFIKHKFSTVELLALVLLSLAAGCLSRYVMGFCTYTIIAPVFILSTAELLNRLKLTRFKAVLIALGKASLYMWFIHAVFFSGMTRQAFQNTSWWPGNVVVIYVLVLTVSYLISFILLKFEGTIKRGFLKK